MEREPARSDKRLRALVEELVLDQSVGDETLQILRGLPLHAGGDFFGEEFEKKIGH